MYRSTFMVAAHPCCVQALRPRPYGHNHFISTPTDRTDSGLVLSHQPRIAIGHVCKTAAIIAAPLSLRSYSGTMSYALSPISTSIPTLLRRSATTTLINSPMWVKASITANSSAAASPAWASEPLPMQDAAGVDGVNAQARHLLDR
jgi:hypothetical protein